MFEHAGVAIRPIEESDLPKMVELRADPRIWQNLGEITMISLRAQQEWFNRLQGDSRRKYYILCAHDIPFLGIVRMDEIDWLNRSIRVGGDILPEYQGKNHGTQMFELLKEYCFSYLNMHRMWLFVLEDHKVARHLYRKAGFVEEGRQRQAIFRHGRYQDYVMMSLLAQDWKRTKMEAEAMENNSE